MRAATPAALAAALAALPAVAQLNCNPGVEFHPDGPLRACELNGEHRFEVPGGRVLVCADGGRIELDREGRVRRCVLARPVEGQDTACPVGATAEFAPGGGLARCEGS